MAVAVGAEAAEPASNCRQAAASGLDAAPVLDGRALPKCGSATPTTLVVRNLPLQLLFLL